MGNMDKTVVEPADKRNPNEALRFDDAYSHYGDTGSKEGEGASTRGMVFADSATRPLSDADLDGKGDKDVLIARNEIYARHGRPFATPELAAHFQSQPWYEQNTSFKDSDLSPIEQRNVLFLNMKEIENGWNGVADKYKGTAYQGDTKGSVLPESSTRPLTGDDLRNLSPEQIATARNELYARHGRPFTTKSFADHFASMPWYQKNDKFTDADLSPMEYRNIQFIKLWELDHK